MADLTSDIYVFLMIRCHPPLYILKHLLTEVTLLSHKTVVKTSQNCNFVAMASHFSPSSSALSGFCPALCLYVCMSQPLLDTLYEWGHAVFVFLSLDHFTSCNVLRVHPCRLRRPDVYLKLTSIPSLSCTHVFFLSSSTLGPPGRFHIMAIVNIYEKNKGSGVSLIG